MNGDVTPCSLVAILQRFTKTYYPACKFWISQSGVVEDVASTGKELPTNIGNYLPVDMV
jgi:hypothetical protein